MKLTLRLSLLILAVFGAAPAMAQIDQRPLKSPREEAALMGRCLVNASGGYWRRVIDEPFGDRASFDLFEKGILASSCIKQMVNEVRFPPILARGMIYNALYERDFKKAPPIASFEDAPAIVFPVAETAPASVADQYRNSMAIGECVARAMPVETRNFVLSRVGSPEEQAALGPLMPALQQCIPEGMEVTLKISVVRAAVVEPLYRLTQARVKP